MKKLLAVCAALAAIVTFSSFMLTTGEKTEAQLLALQTQRVCFTVADEYGDPLIGASVMTIRYF